MMMIHSDLHPVGTLITPITPQAHKPTRIESSGEVRCPPYNASSRLYQVEDEKDDDEDEMMTEMMIMMIMMMKIIGDDNDW